MTDIFSQWLHAVIYTGIVCSIALMLSPDGRVKNALKILCAVAMCAAIVSPLSELDFDAYSKAMARCRLDAEQYTTQGEQYSKNLNRTIIEDECRAYILDKANETGTELAEVTVTAAGESGALSFRTLLLISAGFVLLCAGLSLLNYASQPRFLERAMRQYKDFAFKKLIGKSISSFRDESAAGYLSALTNDAASIETNYLAQMLAMITKAVTFIVLSTNGSA